MKDRIAIIEDEVDLLDTCRQVLADAGHSVHPFSSPAEFLESLAHERYGLALLDHRLPGKSGIELIRALRESCPETAAVMMTAYPTIDLAILAMREGAFDFILKPFSPEHLCLVVERALGQQKLARRHRNLRRSLELGKGNDLVWKSAQLDRVIARADQVADSGAAVLIVGEPATGKRMLARRIHQLSSRAGEPMISINCAGVDPVVLESELFGGERPGATIPGGRTDFPASGFEYAEGGTLFLEEIGELPASLQLRLLNVLEDGCVRRAGDRVPIETDFRLISTTQQDLVQRARDGTFRQDLLYRLGVVTLTIPPFRDRREDILALAESLIQRYTRRDHKPEMALDPEARDMLVNYAWPGNGRELANIIERAVLLGSGPEITPLDLPEEMLRSPVPAEGHAAAGGAAFVDAKREQVETFERDYVHNKLLECRGNVSRAAQLSRLGRSAFQRLMRRYGIQSESYRG